MNFSFSIIVPIYKTNFNQLSECLKSLVTQDNNLLYEIILVDDGNDIDYKENLSKLINSEFNDFLRKIRLIHLSINQGLAYARKMGYKSSKGEIIIFVDSDDWISDKNFLNKMNNYFNKYDNIDAIKHKIKKITNNKIFKKPTKYNESLSLKEIQLSPDNFFNENNVFGCYYQMLQGYVFKRESINHQMMWNTIKEYHEDEYFFSCLLSNKINLLVTNEEFYCYRVDNTGSITSSYHALTNKNEITQNNYLRILRVQKWLSSFDNNINNSEIIRDFWIWLCINISISTGFYISRKYIDFFPSNDQIKSFLKKYKIFNHQKLGFIKHIYIYIVLSSEFLDKVLSRIYRKLTKCI